MRPITLLLALGLCVTVSACSGNAKDSFRNVDHDRDGKITYEELLFVFPELTPRTFRQIDRNGDGFISESEYALFLKNSSASAAPKTAVLNTDHSQKGLSKRSHTTDTMQPAVPFKGEKVIEIAPPVKTPASTGKRKPHTTPATTAKKQASQQAGMRHYTVVRGDNLTKIAHHFGVTVEAITQANGNMSPDVLSDGQELLIPPRP